MPYLYELGYGTYEESEYSQIQHEKEFTQEEFNDMVLKCVVKAAKEVFDEAVNDFNSPESKKEKAEGACFNRKHGDEFMYEICIETLMYMHEARLTYQSLHKRVTELMTEDFGFVVAPKTATISFFGWSDLANENDWEQNEHEPNRTASRMVREQVCDKPANNSEQRERRDRRIDMLKLDPEKVYAEDRALIESLGVTYVPYDDPVAVSKRQELEDKWG
jgi:hypothetical protein